MEDGPKYPVGTLIKAIEMIDHMARDPNSRGSSITELSRELGIGKSTVHRLLDTLTFFGYVAKDSGTNRYKLGWELYKLGQVVPQQNQLSSIDRRPMIELHRAVNEAVNLAMLKDGETVLIYNIDGPHDGLTVSLNPGVYESIHATALGKVLVCEMCEKDIERLVNSSAKFRKYTKNTITDMKALLAELAAVRERGWGEDAEEYRIGLRCIAMPVRCSKGKIAAAVSVSAPSARMTDDKRAAVIDALKHASQEMSESLGWRPDKRAKG